jgi:cytochrome c-type biogenesis protein CcmH
MINSVIPSAAKRSRGIFSPWARLIAWREGLSTPLRFGRGDGIILLLTLLFSFPALAVEPSEVLADPVLEARARTIGQALRCVVCQNQSIDDSAAEVAHDMRRAVRERLSAGDSNDQVFAFMVARYGDYVLLKPPFKTGTLVLWLGAPLLLLIAGGALLVAARRRQRTGIAAPQPLSDEERERLRVILSDKGR